MTVSRAREKLDKFVSLRGEIAHRGKAAKSVTKADVEDYFCFLNQIVTKTDGAVNSHVTKVTGIALRPRLRRKRPSTH